MINNHQSIQAINVVKDVSYKILLDQESGLEPRDKEQVILIMKMLNEMVNACTKPSSISETMDIVLNGKKLKNI